MGIFNIFSRKKDKNDLPPIGLDEEQAMEEEAPRIPPSSGTFSPRFQAQDDEVNQRPFNNQNFSSSKTDMDLLLTKLDLINQRLEVLDRRIQVIEKIARESQE